MNSLNRQLEECIANIVMPMEAQGVDIISPDFVANMVDEKIDPDRQAPELKTYTSTLQIKQSVRSFLRRRHDPVEKAEIADSNMDLFGSELQLYYPVTIKLPDGSNDKAYKQRHLLTQQERGRIAKTMRQAARTLLSHADALVAEGIDTKSAA